MIDTNKLAIDFCILLRHYLLPEEMTEVIERNRVEPDERVCHSHDFLDANEVMAEAVTLQGVEFDVQDEDQRISWNAAWYAAKAVEFDITELGGEL